MQRLRCMMLATLVALSALVAVFVYTPECMQVGRHARRAREGKARGW